MVSVLSPPCLPPAVGCLSLSLSCRASAGRSIDGRISGTGISVAYLRWPRPLPHHGTAGTL